MHHVLIIICSSNSSRKVTLKSATSSTVHIFYLFQSINHFQPYISCTLLLAHDSTIHTQSSITIRPNMNIVFGPLIGSEANMKRTFGTALVVKFAVKMANFLPYSRVFLLENQELAC